METQQASVPRNIDVIKIQSSKIDEDHDVNYINFIVAMCDAIYTYLCEEKLSLKKDIEAKQ